MIELEKIPCNVKGQYKNQKYRDKILLSDARVRFGIIRE